MLNAIRTTMLIALMTALFMAVGLVVGGTAGMFIAFGIALVTNAIGYWNSDKIVLRMQNARPISRDRSPELYRMVEDLAERAGLPVPAIFLIETDQPNAFATGRNPDNAAVAVSSGLVRMLERDELAGVIAHELAHIRSRDTLVMTLTGTLAGAISMLAHFGLFFGGRGNNPFGMVGALLAVIVAPLAAMLVQMAVSRTREYEADRDGAEICGQPMALASALEKISAGARRIPNPAAHRSPGMAHLFIMNPLSGKGSDNLFSTHPSVENRVARLRDLRSGTTGPAAGPARRAAPRPANRRQSGDGSTRGAGWRIPETGSEKDRNAGPWG